MAIMTIQIELTAAQERAILSKAGGDPLNFVKKSIKGVAVKKVTLSNRRRRTGTRVSEVDQFFEQFNADVDNLF